MKSLWTVTIICLVVAASILTVRETAIAADAGKESAYDHIIKTRTIRCGYNYYEPVIMRDPNTGEFSGIFPEYMEALAKATGLNIEWTQEVGWGDVPAALQSGKIDAMCAGKWADAKDGVQSAFTVPVFFNAIEAYVRADDHRFDDNMMSAINDPAVTIAAIDGGVTEDIATEDFPKARRLQLTIMETDINQLINVSMGKADITFTNHGQASGFMKNNPGKIRRLAPDKPLRVYGVTTAIDIHERELLSLLNTATQQLQNSGVIDRILDKYESDYPGAFSRVAKPYQTQHEEKKED
ncbi:MAG: transporter substrate-binding domain-containing protein [Rhodospirillales bacterium]|nr:transporter substrate-binding domain-containing protein [Rhodospirillales bacterium]